MHIPPTLTSGQPAPDFSLPRPNGRLFRLAEQRGRIVIVNFWSAECDWCKRIDPALTSLVQGWGVQVLLTLVSANLEEDYGEVVRTAEDRNVPPPLRDSHQQAARLYGAKTTPHFFVIDNQGILQYQGAFDDVTFQQRRATRAYLAKAVEQILTGKEPEITTSTPYGCALTIL